jgi:hypothetical protein
MGSTLYQLTVLPVDGTHKLQPLSSDSHDTIKRAIGESCSIYILTSYHLWRTDGTRAPTTLYLDEEGLLKGLYPNHFLNALIDAGRFETTDFKTIQADTHNQAIKDSGAGANYIVGNAVIEIPEGEALPDLNVCGDTNPIRFLHRTQDPHQDYQTRMRRHPLMTIQMPTYATSFEEMRHAMQNPTWISKDYHLAPKRTATPDASFHKLFLAMLREWGVELTLEVC